MAHLLGRVSMDTLESVLLFDPDTDTAEMYGVGLELAGFRARVTSSDAEARSVLRQERPAAVIADVGAGAAEAWELIQLLRADRSTRDIPIVVLAGRTDPWIGKRAAALGCVKPCLPDALAAAVRESLQTS